MSRTCRLNVLLFIPLGMFVATCSGEGSLQRSRSVVGISLFIELTQLTGDWGLYPCAYRFFSTADVITNTIGAGIGAFCPRSSRLVPGQSTPTTQAELRRVTPRRRYLAAMCNVALIAAVGFALLAAFGLLLDATRGQLFVSESIAHRHCAPSPVLVPGTATFLVIPLMWRGRTPGSGRCSSTPRTPVPAPRA